MNQHDRELKMYYITYMYKYDLDGVLSLSTTYQDGITGGEQKSITGHTLQVTILAAVQIKSVSAGLKINCPSGSQYSHYCALSVHVKCFNQIHVSQSQKKISNKKKDEFQK